jgi:hypothetical protein
MLREHLKCPVCGESEIVCELSGCDRISDVPVEPETDLSSFVIHVGDKIWETPPLQLSNN